jgi:hypothetical protein
VPVKSWQSFCNAGQVQSHLALQKSASSTSFALMGTLFRVVCELAMMHEEVVQKTEVIR